MLGSTKSRRRQATAAVLLGGLIVGAVFVSKGQAEQADTAAAKATAAPLFAPPSDAVRIPTAVDLLGPGYVQQCQALGPAAPFPIQAVDSAAGLGAGGHCGTGHCGQPAEVGWDARGHVNFQQYAQGEYVGAARLAHVPEYRLRVDDQLAVYFLRTRSVQQKAYRLQVGDRIRVESLTAGEDSTDAAQAQTGGSADSLDREVVVQPDGMITLPLNVIAPAAGRTLAGLQEDLERRYKQYYRVPSITVTPILINTRLTDLLDAVDSRGGQLGGRQIQVVVTPAGQIQLPGLGSVYVQGLTIAEAKREIDARYDALTPGATVTVDLTQRAPRFIYVLGEVPTPGQFALTGPTTVMQSIALAGGWNVGANLRQVVVFRRGPDWRLLATIVDVRGSLHGRRPVPADEIWLADSDVVLVPKTPIEIVDEFVEQFFTRGLYAAVPLERIWGSASDTVTAITSAQ